MDNCLIKLKQYIFLLKKYLSYRVNVDFYELENLKQFVAKATLNLFVSSLLLRIFFPDFFLRLLRY